MTRQNINKPAALIVGLGDASAQPNVPMVMMMSSMPYIRRRPNALIRILSAQAALPSLMQAILSCHLLGKPAKEDHPQHNASAGGCLEGLVDRVGENAAIAAIAVDRGVAAVKD